MAATGDWRCTVTTSDYHPIACDLHSEYELLAMRRAWVWLDAQLPSGPVAQLRCRVLDVQVRDRAEFLELETVAGDRLSCRLDRVSGMRLEDGRQISG